MTRFAAALAALCFLVGNGLAAPGGATTQEELWQEFVTGIQDGDWETVRAAGERVHRFPTFEWLPDADKAAFFGTMSHAAIVTGHPDDASRYADIAEQFGVDAQDLTALRFQIHVVTESWLEAHAALVALHEADSPHFDSVFHMTLDDILDGLRELEANDDELDLLGRILADYDSPEPFFSNDGYRMRLMRRLVERNELAAALAHIPDIESAEWLSVVRYDGSFRALWDHADFDTITDVEARAQDELQLRARVAADNPTYLRAQLRHMGALSQVGQLEEAARIGKDLYERHHAGEVFEDSDTAANWLLNDLAYTEVSRGNIDFARQLMRDGAELDEYWGANVSQVINLAHLELDIGDYDGARRTIAQMEGRDASDYGWMLVWMVETCAAHALGDTAAADDHLARMAEDWSSAPHAYQDALICTDREEEAAALLIERLGDEDYRESALATLQHRLEYTIAPELEPAQRRRAALRALAQRPDVAAAVAEAGRVESWNLYEY